MHIHNCILVPGKYTGKGRLYDVQYEGKTLVKGVYDPEYEACRALAALGMVGECHFYGSTPLVLRAFVKDLGKAAMLRTTASKTGRPVVGKYYG